MNNVTLYLYQNNLKRVIWHAKAFMTRFPNWSPRPPLGTTERFPGGHEQRPLLKSSVVILQNPIDQQRATRIGTLWKGRGPQTMTG